MLVQFGNKIGWISQKYLHPLLIFTEIIYLISQDHH